MAFNWEDHPVVESSPTPAPKAIEGKAAFNWDAHPVTSDSISTTPVADKIANFASKTADVILPSIDKARWVAKHLPVGSEAADSYLQSVQDAMTGAQEGATLGARDEIIGGLKGAGKTALEGLTGELPKNKSAMEELHDNYRKYQKAAQDEQDAAHARGWSAAAGNLVGGALTGGMAFKAAKGLGLAGKAAVGGTLGTAGGVGASKGNFDNLESNSNIPFTDIKVPEVAKDALVGLGLGTAGTVVGEKVLAPGLAWGANKAMNHFSNSSGAKQLAATIQNASKGGSVFGEEGPIAIDTKTNDLSKDVAENLTSDLKAKNDAFKVLNTPEVQAQRLLPTRQQIKENIDLQALIEPHTDAFNEQFDKLNTGNMHPGEAQNFRAQLKDFISGLHNEQDSFARPGAKKLANQIQNSGFLSKTLEDGSAIPGTLESLSKDAGTDIHQLNIDKQGSWKRLEPLLQKGNDIIPETNFQPKDASSFSTDAINLKIKTLMEGLQQKAGSTTESGTKAQRLLAELQQLVPNNGTEVATQLQNQAYLNGAKQSAQGVKFNTGLTLDKVNPFTAAKDQSLLWAAEKLSGSKTAQDISSKLLSKDPAQRLENAKNLGKIPQAAKLAKQYYDAAQMNDNQKLTNVAFQVMQNPEMKQALGGSGSNISGSIPGVVPSDKDGKQSQ